MLREILASRKSNEWPISGNSDFFLRKKYTEISQFYKLYTLQKVLCFSIQYFQMIKHFLNKLQKIFMNVNAR